MHPLRRIRVRRGLTIKDLQERTGVNRGTISRAERRERTPLPPTLQRLADALGVEIEELMEEETSKEEKLAV
jgi:transcriptional regulator with XRE-family HTH domain